ncbi:MAG: PAS domain S-box protein [Candidatus Hydrogenedentes bacterium]|nr:PAS domain S-box protein [Candidatus Hydrogenedentota bacterium]
MNDISRLLFATGSFGGTPHDPWPLVISMIAPFCANAFILVIALVFAVRGWFRDLEREDLEQKQRRRKLEALVDERTVELARTAERLAADVREREQIETTLRAEHAMLEAIMQTSVGAICVVNADGQIVFANSVAQSVLGVSADETTSRRYNSAEWQHTDLDGRPLPEDQQPFRRVMQSREPIHNMRHAIASPDGTTRILEINGAPLFGADGAVSGVVFLVNDITRRMADEEIVRDSEKRFRIMVEGLPSGAVFVDGDRIYMNFAAERITGYSRTELSTVDQWFWALYGERSAEARAQYERIRDAGFAEVCIGTVRRKDGAVRVIDCNGYRSDSATIWLLRDITDLARADEDRRRFESHLFKTHPLEDLSVIAEGIAHDCNDILTGILGAAELAQREATAENASRAYIDEIARGAERAAELCAMLAALSSHEDHEPGPVDINAAVADMVRFMRGPEGKTGRVTFEFDLDAQMPVLCADASQVRAVVLALLKNAVEAIAGGAGTVRVSTGTYGAVNTHDASGLPAGEYACVHISDTGRGMTDGERAKAFEPFFTTKPGAHGLGLTHAIGIVRSLGGNVAIESDVGKGTTATVYLPVSLAQQTATKPGATPSGELWFGSGTILVVDDEQNVRSVTKRMLEKLGFEVVLASSGAEAVQQVERRRDLAAVILDLAMPNMDGGATFEEIRRSQPRLPVLIATGFDTKKVTGRFPRGAVSGFLQKPYPMRVLSEHLRDALQKDPHNASN